MVLPMRPLNCHSITDLIRYAIRGLAPSIYETGRSELPKNRGFHRVELNSPLPDNGVARCEFYFTGRSFRPPEADFERTQRVSTRRPAWKLRGSHLQILPRRGSQRRHTS